METERITNVGYIDEDVDIELSLRPKRLADYIGQQNVKENHDV